MRPNLLVLVLIPIAAAGQIHYSYSGSDPARWTTSVLKPRQAAAPGDFTAYACDASNCSVAQLTMDAKGNTYVVGSRYFSGPTSDVFIAKIDSAGATVFLATLGGSGSSVGNAIALDPAGNIVVAGATSSPDFPLRNPIQPQLGLGPGFVTELPPMEAR